MKRRSFSYFMFEGMLIGSNCWLSHLQNPNPPPAPNPSHAPTPTPKPNLVPTPNSLTNRANSI